MLTLKNFFAIIALKIFAWKSSIGRAHRLFLKGTKASRNFLTDCTGKKLGLSLLTIFDRLIFLICSICIIGTYARLFFVDIGDDKISRFITTLEVLEIITEQLLSLYFSGCMILWQTFTWHKTFFYCLKIYKVMLTLAELL